jgi:hypothetical protein
VRLPAGMRQLRKRGRKGWKILILMFLKMVARDSVVGLATRYGLDGPGIESRWRRDLRTRPDRPWGHNHLLYNGYRVLPGVLTNHPHIAPRLKKEYSYTSTPSLGLRGLF